MPAESKQVNLMDGIATKAIDSLLLHNGCPCCCKLSMLMWDVCDVQARLDDEDSQPPLKHVFSNGLPGDNFDLLQTIAKDEMGMRLLETKEGVSVHLVNLDLNTSTVMSFRRQG